MALGIRHTRHKNGYRRTSPINAQQAVQVSEREFLLDVQPSPQHCWLQSLKKYDKVSSLNARYDMTVAINSVRIQRMIELGCGGGLVVSILAF